LIKATKLQVRPLKKDQALITWSFSQTLEDFSNYEFTLLRSESEAEGSFETIFKFTDEVSYLDKGIWVVRLWRSLFYKVHSKNKLTGEEHETEPACVGMPPNLEAMEIVRRHEILLSNPRHGIGTPCAAFNRKKSGVACECWDAEKKRMRKSDCTDCFGTHFLNGFYAPQLIWINFSPDSKTVVIPEWGESEPNDSKALTTNYPELSPKDVIVDPNHYVCFIVNNVEVSARRNYGLHQVMDLGYVDRSHVLYSLLDKYKTFMDSVLAVSANIELRG
jgi:hypothetical protein